MAHKFVTTREIDLINFWNKELIQGVVEQEVIYYAVDVDGSHVHDVYDEAVEKGFLPPVRINARVEFDQTATTAGNGRVDSTYTAVVQLHKDECIDRNIRPREGDFIEFGQFTFEVTTVSDAQPVFGQMNDKLKYELTCISSRETQFKVGNVAIDGIDNTHPVEPTRPRTLGDDL